MNADSAFAASLHASAITVTTFTVMVILYLKWHRDTPGLRWWAAANALIALTMHLYALRGDDWFGEGQQSVWFVFTTIWMTGLLLTCALLCVLAGIVETIELKRFPRALLGAAVLQLASHAWFTFAEPGVIYRAISLAVYLSFAFAFCAYVMLRRAGPELRGTARMAAAVFLLISLSYVYRFGSLFVEWAAGHTQSSIVAGQGTFSALAAVNILWTVTAITLGEQKRRCRAALRTGADRKVELRQQDQCIREEVARDLHDTLGGTIATISLLSARKNGDGNETLGKVRSLAQDARNDIRMLMNTLSNNALTELQWMAECRDLAESITKAGDLQLDWRAEGFSDRIIGEPMAALGLMRGIRESLSNIVRHAGSTRASLHFVANASQLEISVHDNGIGLPENHVPGFGLSNIRSRVRELGGMFTTENNSGTKMRLTIPLPLAFQTGTSTGKQASPSHRDPVRR